MGLIEDRYDALEESVVRTLEGIERTVEARCDDLSQSVARLRAELVKAGVIAR